MFHPEQDKIYLWRNLLLVEISKSVAFPESVENGKPQP